MIAAGGRSTQLAQVDFEVNRSAWHGMIIVIYLRGTCGSLLLVGCDDIAIHVGFNVLLAITHVIARQPWHASMQA